MTRLPKYAAYAALTIILVAAAGTYTFYRSLLPRDLPMRPALTAPPLVRGAVRAMLGTGARETAARLYLESREFPHDGYQKRRMRVFALKRWLGHWSDDEVAEGYVMQARVGNGVGLAAGAQALFARPLQQLTPDEVALLMVVAWSPNTEDPACHPTEAKDARDRLLVRMADARVVPAGDLAKLLATPIHVLRACLQGS